MKTSHRHNNLLWIIGLVVAFFFAIIINMRTPMMWEDVVYTLKADPALGMAMSNSAVADTIQLGRYNQVASLPDLAESTYHHYMNANGRLFPHLTSQVFGAFVGKTAFNVLNAFMFILLIYTVTLLSVGKRDSFWPWTIITLAGLWLFMPESNTGFFLMTYALNYLWSSVLCAAFLYLYQVLGKKSMPCWAFILGCVFAFGAGWSHEGLAVGISGALILDNLSDLRSHRANRQKMTWGIFFCIGAFLLCIAPGNFTRTDAALPLYNHLLSFTRLKVFWLFITSWLLFSRRIDFIRQNSLLLSALFVQMAFMFYVGYRNGRVLWGTELFSLILLIKVFADEERNASRLIPVSSVLLGLLLCHFSWLTYRSGKIRQQYEDVIALYQKSETGDTFYDLQAESDLVRDYIPTPLCYNKPFELVAFSVYFTRNQKSLHIYPKAMQQYTGDAPCIYHSPIAWYIIGKDMEHADIEYTKHSSINPKYSSYATAIKNLFDNREKLVEQRIFPSQKLNGYDLSLLPQNFDGEITSVKIINKQSWN